MMIIREAYVKITGGDVYAAGLLNQIVYKIQWLKDVRQYVAEWETENGKKAPDGLMPKRATLRVSLREMEEWWFGGRSKDSVHRDIVKLVARDFIRYERGVSATDKSTIVLMADNIFAACMANEVAPPIDLAVSQNETHVSQDETAPSQLETVPSQNETRDQREIEGKIYKNKKDYIKEESAPLDLWVNNLAALAREDILTMSTYTRNDLEGAARVAIEAGADLEEIRSMFSGGGWWYTSTPWYPNRELKEKGEPMMPPQPTHIRKFMPAALQYLEATSAGSGKYQKDADKAWASLKMAIRHGMSIMALPGDTMAALARMGKGNPGSVWNGMKRSSESSFDSTYQMDFVNAYKQARVENEQA